MFPKYQSHDYGTESGMRAGDYRLSLTVDKTERLNEVTGNRITALLSAGMEGLWNEAGNALRTIIGLLSAFS